MCSTLHGGEISLQSLGSERPLMLHEFCYSMRMMTETWIPTNKYFRATESKTMLKHEKAGGFLRWTDARIHSMEKSTGRHDKWHTTQPGFGQRRASAWTFCLSSHLPWDFSSVLQYWGLNQGRHILIGKCSTAKLHPNFWLWVLNTSSTSKS